MSYPLFWPEFPGLSIACWLLLGLAVLYLVRERAHLFIERLSRAGHRQLRLLARAAAALAARINARNREVMLALQTEITRRQLEREFHRMAAAVEQDMTKFQHLERAINEHLTLLGEDFERSSQVPPAAPGWIAAVDAIAKLQAENNPEAVGRILQDIHSSVQDQQREVMREYRWAVNARHKILADMRPLWWRVGRQVTAVGRDSRDLLQRVHRVDTLMAAFRELCANRADAHLESFLARWLLALALTGVAALLALLNVHLLTPPLAGLVGAGGSLALDLPMLTAAVYTLAVLAAALLLSECTQVSRLLPLVGGLPRHTRIALTVVACALLLLLIAGQALLLLQSVGSALPVWSRSLPAWELAGIGVVVPLLLALLAPAVESLLATSRPALASIAAAALSVCGLLLRVAGRLWLELGRLSHHLYDLALFLPLALERAWQRHRARRAAEPAPVIGATNVTAVDFERVRPRSSEESVG
jgi:hypothetical protein